MFTVSHVSLSIVVITDTVALNAWLTRINDFLNSARNQVSFKQEPDYLKSISEENDCQLFIVLIIDGDRVVFYSPAFLRVRPFPITFSTFKINGRSARIIEMENTPIVASEFDEELGMKKFMQVLWQHQDTFDLIRIENLEKSTTLAKYLSKQSSTNNHKLSHFDNTQKEEYVWRITFGESFAQWVDSLGRSTRQLIRKRLRKADAKLSDKLSFTHYSTAEEMGTYQNAVDVIYSNTWQAKTFGCFKRNTEEQIRFSQALAKQKLLDGYVIHYEDKPVAFFTGGFSRAKFEAVEIGYDSNYSSMGIGQLLSFMVIRNLHERGDIETLSFGFGSNNYKSMICDNHSAASEVFIAHGKWALLIRCQQILNRIENGLRSMLTHLNLDSFVRKRLKNK